MEHDRPFTRAELEAVQDDYELNTGERPSLEVASVLLDRQREADSYRDEYTVEEAVEDFKAYEADKPAPDAECWECGKLGDYYDGICYECASRPFGLLWQLEQPGRHRPPTREEVEVYQEELKRLKQEEKADS